MAVPSRIYFVITLFALVVTLVSVPFTIAVLVCDDSATPTGIPCFQGPRSIGAKVFLSLASLFTLAFTIMSWRALKAGARRDMAIRKARALAADVSQEAPNRLSAKGKERDEEPPGYG